LKKGPKHEIPGEARGRSTRRSTSAFLKKKTRRDQPVGKKSLQ